MHHSAPVEVMNKVQRITSIGRQEFPFTYLCCPIFYSRRKMEYDEGFINKVMDKMQSWKGKLLSIGGRAILISHVLQTMPIHLFSVVNPPSYVITELHKMFARFFGVVQLEAKADIGHLGTLCVCHVKKVRWGLGHYMILPKLSFASYGGILEQNLVYGVRS